MLDNHSKRRYNIHIQIMQEVAFVNIRYFLGESEKLYISEFAYSEPGTKQFVGPRIRDDYILHFVVEGESLFCGKKVEAGQVFLISRCLLHEFSVEKGYKHYWIAFGGTQAGQLLEKYGVPPVRNMIYDVVEPCYAKTAIATALESCTETDSGERIACGMLLTMLSLLKIEHKSEVTPKKATDYAERAMQFIEKNCHRNVTMQQLASYIMISEKHLCRLFKQRYGIPPQKYLINTRMQRAKRLLLETDLLVKEVATSVGYSSQLDFSRMYAKHFGHPPTKEREKT